VKLCEAIIADDYGTTTASKTNNIGKQN